jgi:hypothetical protein
MIVTRMALTSTTPPGNSRAASVGAAGGLAPLARLTGGTEGDGRAEVEGGVEGLGAGSGESDPGGGKDERRAGYAERWAPEPAGGSEPGRTAANPPELTRRCSGS